MRFKRGLAQHWEFGENEHCFNCYRFKKKNNNINVYILSIFSQSYFYSACVLFSDIGHFVGPREVDYASSNWSYSSLFFSSSRWPRSSRWSSGASPCCSGLLLLVFGWGNGGRPVLTKCPTGLTADPVRWVSAGHVREAHLRGALQW